MRSRSTQRGGTAAGPSAARPCSVAVTRLARTRGAFRSPRGEASLEPLIAMGRQPHHPPLDERFAKEGPAPENQTPVEAMAHRLKSKHAA